MAKLTKSQEAEISRRKLYRSNLRKLAYLNEQFKSKYADDYLQSWRSQDELDSFYRDVDEQQRIAQALQDYHTASSPEYESFSKLSTGYRDLLADRKAVSDLYGGFKNLNEWKSVVAKNEASKAEEARLDKLDINEISAQSQDLGKKITSLVQKRNRATREGVLTQAERKQYDDQIELYQNQKKKIDADIEKINKRMRLGELEAVKNSEGFDIASAFDDSVQSSTYRIINGLTGSDANVDRGYRIDDDGWHYDLGQSNEDQIFAENMTADEKKIYNALRYEDPAKAKEYLALLDPVIAMRASEKAYRYGKEHPFLGTVDSILSNATGAAQQFGSMVKFEDVGYNQSANLSSSLREGVSSNMTPLGSFLYNTGISGAESLVASLVPYAGEAMLALSAAANAQNDILRRGGTDSQALVGGFASGIAEAFFEHFSLGTLRSMDTKAIVSSFKDFISNIGKEVLVNASEEAATELTNILSDTFIMGEISTINTAIDRYMASGMSEADAYLKATMDIAMQIGESAASGALMGFGFSAVGSTVGVGQNYSVGSRIMKDQVDYGDLLQMGSDLSVDKDNSDIVSTIKLYEKTNKKQQSKSPAQKVRVGALHYSMTQEEVQKALKAINEKSKANIPQTVTTAENAAKTANVSTADADIRKSNAPKIVSAEGQALSEIFVEKDGQAVSLDKLSIEDSDLAMAYSYAVTTGSVESANEFISAYTLSGDNTAPTTFWSSWMGIMASGQTLSTTDENMQKVFAEYGDTLSDSAKLSAWLSGVTSKQKASERRIKAAEQARELWEKDGRKVTRGSIDASALQGVDLDSKQREFVAFGRLFAESLGMNVKFVASKKGDRGDNGSYNRKTNTITLDVFAGIGNNANYNAVQSALANTLSHEVVHNMRIVAPKEYDALSDYVFDTLKAQGVDIEERIQYQIAQSKDKKLSREDAIEEIVAHACDGMLKTSETVREFMEGFYAKDRSAARRFEQKVREILKKLKEVFDTLLGTKAYSEEARTLYKAGSERVAEIQKLFDKGVLAMREGNLARNYEVQGLVAPGVTITPDNTIVLQQRQYRETGRASVLDYLTEQYGKDTAEDMISTMDRLYEVVDQIKDENPELNIFSQWQETEVELDDEGHPIFSSNIKNGDYPLNQDFSRVCKKRRQLDEVLNWLASNDDFTVAYLTKDDYKKINDIIKNHGFEVACDLCFVDAKRFRQSEWAESFAETWNDLLNSVMVSGNATTFNFATDSMDIAPTDVVIAPSRPISYRKWSEGKVTETRSYKNLDDFLKNDRNTNVKNMMKLIVQNEDMRHTFRAADVISSKGFDSIQRNAPQIRQILNGWGGSSAPKSSSLDSVYDNSILNIGGYNQEAAYAVGGVRMNSFSDFIAHMFFDYCQAFADLDAKKLPMQAYSKELTFFLLFGRTGGKLNMSGIPAARTPSNGKYTKLEIEKRFAGLDIEPLARYLGKPVNKLTVADCLEHLDMLDYLWAKESIDIKKATLLQSGIRFDKLSNDKIDKCYDLIKKKNFDEAHSVAGRENVDLEYTKNVGIIAVGVSEPHIRKLLRDHTIRMVIPYHKSGLNPVIAKALHIHTYMDYTNTQSTKIQYKGEAARNLNKDDHIVPFSFYDYFGKTIDGVFYDAKATANRYIQWCREMSTDEYTIIPKFNEFTNEENYYKLLEDFDCYNTITELHEAQNAVNFFGDTFPADYKSIITKELKAEQKTRDDFRTELDSTGMRQEILDVVRKRGFKGEAEEMRQARANTVDGRIVAVIEDDILSGIYSGQWDKNTAEKAKKAAKTALLKFKDGIAVKGITAKVNRDSRREYTRSNYSEALRKHDPDTYADKLRAASVADDVVIAATNWKRDGGLTKPRKDDFVDFDRGQTLIMSGSNKYSATVIIGITKQGDFVFYDVEDMSPTQFEIKNEGDLPTVTPDKPFDDILKVSNANSIPQNQQMSSSFEKNSSDELSQQRISTPDPSELLKNVAQSKMGFKTYGKYTESLKKYQDLDTRARNQEKRISEIDAEIKTLKHDRKQSGKGTRMDELYRMRKTAEEKVTEYRNRMFAMEAGELSNVVKQETEKARANAQKETREKYQQRYKERTEKAEKREYIEKIEKRTKKLAELLKSNSKDKHVPEVFQKVVGDFLEALDFSSKRYLNGGEKTKKEISLETKMKNLVDILEGRGNNNDLAEFLENVGLTDDDARVMVTEALREAYDKVYEISSQYGNQDGVLILQNLSAEQLKNINSALRTLSHLINQVNELVSNSRYASIMALGKATVDDCKAYKTYTKQGTIAEINKFFKWTNALPYYAFKRMGKAAFSIFESFQDGFDIYSEKITEILAFADNAIKEKDVKKWSNEIHEFKTDSGDSLYMTTADIMSFYCLDKREQGSKHIRGGGIVVPVRKGHLVGQTKIQTFANNPEGIVVSDDLRMRILSELTSEQIEVAKRLQEYMSTVCAEWGNEISLKRFGVRQFTEKFYFPVQPSENTLQKKDQVGSKDRGIFHLLNASFTQNTNDNANNRIVVDNIFDVFASHSIEMAKYNAFALQLIDARKWLNYKTKTDINGQAFKTEELRAMLENAFGKDAEKYIDTFLLDINGADKAGDRGFAVLRRLVGNAKIAAVGLNLNVMLIQPTAYFRASAVINPKYMITVIKDTYQIRQAIKRGEKYSGIFRWKSLGYRGINIAAPIADRIKHTESFQSKFSENVSMKGAELMDKLTWGALWLACENEVADRQNFTKGSDEYYRAVAVRFREVIYATQVVDSPMTKTEFMRSKSFANSIFGSFMSEPSTSYNLFLDVANDIGDTKRKGLKIEKRHLAKLAKVGVAFAVTELVTAVIRSFLDAAHDIDDEDDEYWELYLRNFAENFLEGLFLPKVPIFNDIISAIIAAFTGGYSSSSLEMTAFERVAKFAKNIWRLVIEKDVEWTKLLKSFFDAFSSASSVPLGNVWREVATIFNIIEAAS